MLAAMKTISRAFTSAGLFAFEFVSGCTVTCVSNEHSDAAAPIVGAWQSNVQFDSGAFASVKDLKFMFALNSGGTLTESSNYDGSPPVPPAYGTWRRVDRHVYELRYCFYTNKSPASLDELRSDGGWLPSGHGQLVERITLSEDGRSFKSSLTLALFDQEGHPVEGGGNGHGMGQRMN